MSGVSMLAAPFLGKSEAISQALSGQPVEVKREGETPSFRSNKPEAGRDDLRPRKKTPEPVHGSRLVVS